MSLFSKEDIDSFNITLEVPEKEGDLVKIIKNTLPIGKFKTESLSNREDRFSELISQLPRYTITGDNLSFEFLTNKLRVRMGEFRGSFSGENKLDFNDEILSSVSLDINYLLGIMIEVLNSSFSIVEVNTVLRLFKKLKVIKYSNIANKECKEIFNNGFEISGICLKREKERGLISLKIEEVENDTRITYNTKHHLDGTIDINSIINMQLSEINTLSLKM